MRNFGKKSLDEIKERLAARGLIEAPVRDESSDEGAPVDDASAAGEDGASDGGAPDDGEDELPARGES